MPFKGKRRHVQDLKRYVRLEKTENSLYTDMNCHDDLYVADKDLILGLPEILTIR